MVKYILKRGKIHVIGIINMSLFIEENACDGSHILGAIFENLIAVIFAEE